jgi:hypothetical protein
MLLVPVPMSSVMQLNLHRVAAALLATSQLELIVNQRMNAVLAPETTVMTSPARPNVLTSLLALPAAALLQMDGKTLLTRSLVPTVLTVTNANWERTTEVNSPTRCA